VSDDDTSILAAIRASACDYLLKEADGDIIQAVTARQAQLRTPAAPPKVLASCLGRCPGPLVQQ
jgi:ActR/RegA family two-component response regulator